MSEWKPISTAPRDGTDILITDKDDISVVYWNKYYWAIVCCGGWDPDNEFYYPTHWMPLPALPEEEL